MPLKRDPKAGGGAKRVANKPYAKPDAINNGEILHDITGKAWKIGKSIGVGGFGEIYLASDDTSKAVNDKANYVIKIEPHSNGPLFVEINFYIRVAKKEMIDEWKQLKKLDSLGMPCYVASGSHEYKGQQYRFMVIPRFGQDIYKIVQSKPGARFTLRTVQALALQIIDILEYIHEKNYIHGDIKASNLLLGIPGGTSKKQSTTQQVFLLDYGLAGKYVNSEGNHIPYGPDARKAHNGTLEYTSRDAHIGAFSRRGDLEILGYNMLEWLCGKLPWSNSDPPENVHKQKQAFMANPVLKKLYNGDIQGLEHIEKFLRFVGALHFEEKPNYAQIKELLRKPLPSSHKITTLYIDDVVAPPSSASTSQKKGKADSGRGRPRSLKRAPLSADHISLGESTEEDEIIAKKVCLPEEKKVKRATRTTKKVRHFNWSKVLWSDPEKIVRSGQQIWANIEREAQANSTPEKSHSPPVSNPTPAMIQIMSKKKENLEASPVKPHRFTAMEVVDPTEGTTSMTPAMREILMKKLKKSKKLRKSVSVSDLSVPPLAMKNKRVLPTPHTPAPSYVITKNKITINKAPTKVPTIIPKFKPQVPARLPASTATAATIPSSRVKPLKPQPLAAPVAIPEIVSPIRSSRRRKL